MIRERILFRLFFSLLLLLSFSPFCTYEPTFQIHPNLPTHTIVHSSGAESTVLCEQITTVAVECLGSYIGRCTAAEMEAIDKCLIESIGLTIPSKSKQTLERSVKDDQDDEAKKLQDDMNKIKVELDTYKRMYEIAVNKLATARIERMQKK